MAQRRQTERNPPMEFLAMAVLLGSMAYVLERRLNKIEQRLDAMDSFE
jgi:hypothetical protein